MGVASFRQHFRVRLNFLFDPAQPAFLKVFGYISNWTPSHNRRGFDHNVADREKAVKIGDQDYPIFEKASIYLGSTNSVVDTIELSGS